MRTHSVRSKAKEFEEVWNVKWISFPFTSIVDCWLLTRRGDGNENDKTKKRKRKRKIKEEKREMIRWWIERSEYWEDDDAMITLFSLLFYFVLLFWIHSVLSPAASISWSCFLWVKLLRWVWDLRYEVEIWDERTLRRLRSLYRDWRRIFVFSIFLRNRSISSIYFFCCVILSFKRWHKSRIKIHDNSNIKGERCQKAIASNRAFYWTDVDWTFFWIFVWNFFLFNIRSTSIKPYTIHIILQNKKERGVKFTKMCWLDIFLLASLFSLLCKLQDVCLKLEA